MNTLAALSKHELLLLAGDCMDAGDGIGRRLFLGLADLMDRPAPVGRLFLVVGGRQAGRSGRVVSNPPTWQAWVPAGDLTVRLDGEFYESTERRTNLRMLPVTGAGLRP